MSTAVCPRCGLTEFGPDEQGVSHTITWTEEFLRRCEHVRERRHLSDLRSHTFPHWARAMRDAAEATGTGL